MGTQHVPCFAQESVVLVGPADTGLMSSGRRTLGEVRLRMTEDGGGFRGSPWLRGEERGACTGSLEVGVGGGLWRGSGVASTSLSLWA